MATDDPPRDATPTEAASVTHPGGMRADRVMPTETRSHLDPFVLFERFYIEPSQGFDTHPHYGFEIVSYVLEGGMVHADSMGHESTASAGDAMRITTGNGMRHSELPAEGDACSGLQLWVNLPREEKEAEPSYVDARARELPTEDAEGATVTRVVGEGSPLDLHTPMQYFDARIDGAWTWDVPDGWAGFLYAISGAGRVDGTAIEAGEYLVVADGGAREVAADTGLRVVAIAGRPHGEPIRHRGPFVE